MIAMETAIIIPLPAVEPLVGRWRNRFDSSATEGVPAHVTLMAPFRPQRSIDRGTHAILAGLFAGHPAFSVTFRSARRFPLVLWLSPEPARPFVELTRAITARFPDCLPYGGAFADITPHLTVAHAQESAEVDRIEQEFAPTASAGLPLDAWAETAVLLYRKNQRWREERRYPLGKPAPTAPAPFPE
jgi:hypothetical protein